MRITLTPVHPILLADTTSMTILLQKFCLILHLRNGSSWYANCLYYIDIFNGESNSEKTFWVLHYFVAQLILGPITLAHQAESKLMTNVSCIAEFLKYRSNKGWSTKNDESIDAFNEIDPFVQTRTGCANVWIFVLVTTKVWWSVILENEDKFQIINFRNAHYKTWNITSS